MEGITNMDEIRQALDIHNRAKNTQYYHNAKELLKIYRDVLWQLQNQIHDSEIESLDLGYGHVHQALDLLADIDDDQGLIRLRDQCESMLFTRALILLTDRALFALKQYPGDGEKYFELINRMYIQKCPDSECKLLEAMNISRRTLYREKKKALSMFGVIVWGLMLPGILSGMHDTGMALDWHEDGSKMACVCD